MPRLGIELAISRPNHYTAEPPIAAPRCRVIMLCCCMSCAMLSPVWGPVIWRLQAVLHAMAQLITGVCLMERPHHANIAGLTSLDGRVSVHHLQTCADDIRLQPWPIISVFP